MPERQPELRETGRPGVAEYLALAALTLTVGLATVDRNMLGLLLPLIQEDIHISDTALGLLMGPAFMIVYSLSGLPIAWFADRTGRRNIIAGGLAIWSVVLIATGLAATLAQLVVLRMLLAVGEASNMAPSSALIGDMFRGRHRMIAMSVFSAGGALAILMFYPIIGWLAQNFGWRISYPAMGVIGLAATILVVTLVKDYQKEVEQGSANGSDGAGSTDFKSSIGLLLRSAPYVFLCLAGAAISVSYSVLLFWLPAFFERIHGFETQEVGSLIGTYKGLVGALATFAAGMLVAWLMRFDRRWLAWAPILFCLGMAPAQCLLLLADDPLWYELGLAIETILLSGITPSLFALLIYLVAPRIRATGAAVYLIMFNLVGQSIGPLSVGVINDHLMQGMGDQAIRYSLLVAPAFILLGAFLLLGLALSMNRSDAGAELHGEQ